MSEDIQPSRTRPYYQRTLSRIPEVAFGHLGLEPSLGSPMIRSPFRPLSVLRTLFHGHEPDLHPWQKYKRIQIIHDPDSTEVTHGYIPV